MKLERDAQGRFLKGHPPLNAGAAGRPPSEFSIAGLLRAELMSRPAILKRWVDLAESESDDVALRALISLANRVEGMPKQATEVTGKDGGPVVLSFEDGSPA